MQKFKHFLLLLIVSGFSISTARAQTTILDETLLTPASFGTFTAVNVTGFQNWYQSNQYGAVCSGFSSNQSFENEDWFISPVMNLEDMEDVQLTFSHTRGNAAVMNVGVAEGWYKVYATANYTGNTATTQWIELTGVNQNIVTAWQYVPSGELTIPDAAKSQTSRIAFRYMSSATQSATWEIKNVKVTGETQGTNPGTDGAFKITNWNIEWLGCTTEGPSNETQQVNNVVSAILAMNSDIYCIQEVSNTVANPSIETIVSLLGTDVWAGTIVPGNTGDCNQRQAIIYKKSKVQFVSSFEMSSGNQAQGNSYNYNWSGGRYPAVYNVNLVAGSTLVPVMLVNIHAKAEDNNPESYIRRLGASEALKATLDSPAYNTKNVIVIGDFNDYLVGTNSNSCACTVSPYDNFISDTGNYNGITKNLTATTSWGVRPLIENIIISNELSDNYTNNSAAREVTVAQTISNYYNTTSNHLPVSARFQFQVLGNKDDNYAATSLNIFPNPVKDELHIKDTDALDDTAITIYDVTGRQVYAGKAQGTSLNISTLPSGIYMVRVANKSGRFVKE